VDNKNGNNLTERQLVEKVLGGDTQAFSSLIRRTEVLVAHVVCKMIHHPEDRKDIVQDIYLKVFRNLSTFGFRSQFSTWVARIAYNTCLSFLEKKQIVVYGEWQGDSDPDKESRFDQLSRLHAAPDNDAASTLHSKERAAIIAQSVEQLPPVFKLLISLYHQEELSYQEISLITNLPEGTIKSYLFRARKTLRAQLLRHFKNDEL
jgi:RNA polymerase sigma-70 factor (ECF subfamily)